MAATQPSHRASLLAGLRTGGVRSVSVPHTAGPQASFVVPPPRAPNYPSPFVEEDEMDNLAGVMSHGMHISNSYNPPHTAGCDVSTAPFPYQQQHWSGVQAHPNLQMAGQGQFVPNYGNQQEVQLHMMQMELMRLQALSQLQQYTQYRHDNPQPVNQASMAQNTHLPFQQMVGSGFPDQNENYAHHSVPMTAAIGGRFARRSSHGTGYEEDVSAYGSRRFPSVNLIRGNNGTANGSLRVDSAIQNMAPSKSDSAISWRNNTNEPALTREAVHGTRRSPLLRKPRPEPLELGIASGGVQDLGLSMEAAESSNESSSSKSDGELVSSTPTTPVSGNSNSSLTAVREEASKKLFQGLGLGRPSIHITAPSESTLQVPSVRIVSQPIRQPRGPPASADELGTKNFANRIRKKAIGGLEALLEARERREGTPVNGIY